MATARFWDERFIDGYDMAWSTGEVIGTGPSIDENRAVPAEATVEWGVKCNRIVYVAGEDSYVYHNFAADKNISYYRHEFSVKAESLANNEANKIFVMLHDAVNTIYTGAIAQDGAGQLQFQMNIKHDGTDNFFTQDISLDEVHRAETYWDVTNNLWAWRFDGVDQDSGSITSTPASTWQFTDFLIGSTGATVDAAMTVDNDLVAFDDANWVGPEPAVPAARWMRQGEQNLYGMVAA